MNTDFYRQLALNVHLRDDATLDNYHIGRNREIVDCLRQMPEHDGEPIVYLWGQIGSGRSHLLQACCHRADSLGQSALYLPLGESHGFDPQVLEGLESLALVCLDDIDAIANDREWEEALFFFYNRVRDANTRLLVAGSAQPTQLGFLLPDLASRLAWGMVFHVHSLTDEEKLQVLCSRAKALGFGLPTHVAQFLLRHSNRDIITLLSLLERLDRASLEAQRHLTIPFVKSVLEL